ncbi:MAG: phosphatase PAP2 family protein, partial [Actinobacteria bacterium]|nr:phosphatase PAP2 family protein [Actinomycetota bacterium]
DQFASFPSLHVAWALWVAIAAGSLLRRRAWRVAVWAYPALTVADVLATANHYLLDVVAAPAVVAAGYAAAAALPALARHVRLPRLPVRPAAWQGLATGHAILTATVRAAAAMGTAAGLMTGIPPALLTGELSSLPQAPRLARPPLTAGRAG